MITKQKASRTSRIGRTFVGVACLLMVFGSLHIITAHAANAAGSPTPGPATPWWFADFIGANQYSGYPACAIDAYNTATGNGQSAYYASPAQVAAVAAQVYGGTVSGIGYSDQYVYGDETTDPAYVVALTGSICLESFYGNNDPTVPLEAGATLFNDGQPNAANYGQVCPDFSYVPQGQSCPGSGSDTDLALTNVPANITTAATSSAGAVVTYTPPTDVDEDSSLSPVTCDTPSGSTFSVGTTMVTCTATDSDDTPSTVSASFTITVTDTDLALTNAPVNITTAATSSAGAVVTYTPPTVVDEDGTAPLVSCDTPSGSTFPVGTTTVTCTATDSDDTPSTVSASFTITVTDTDLVLTHVPSNITIKASTPKGAVVTYTPPTAVDEDGTAPLVSCDTPSGSTFPVGTTMVTCTATDSDDTPSTVSARFTVTVTAKDSDLGWITPPANITIRAITAKGAVVTYTPPTAVDPDDVASLLIVTCNHPSGSLFKVGTTKVTCKAYDSDDKPKSVSFSFTITVPDTDLALRNLPANITVRATTTKGAAVTYTPPTAVDEDSPQPHVACTPASGSTFKIGTTTVTCRATSSDDTPKTVSASFTVTVLGASAQVSDLLTSVNSFGLAPDAQASFDIQLQAVQTDLANNKTTQACGNLHAFLTHAQAQGGKQLTAAQASQLITSARRIQAVLGC